MFAKGVPDAVVLACTGKMVAMTFGLFLLLANYIHKCFSSIIYCTCVRKQSRNRKDSRAVYQKLIPLILQLGLLFRVELGKGLQLIDWDVVFNGRCKRVLLRCRRLGTERIKRVETLL